MAFVVIYTVLLFTSLVWLICFIQANDLSVPTKNLSDVYKVLIIFPHADDEALTSGGFISRLSTKGIKSTWVLLTQGEKGNDDAHFDAGLKKVRVAEAQNAVAVFGITRLIQKTYPDYEVSMHKGKIKEELQQIIKEEKPDLIITYDLAGLYGHPDHIAVSEAVTSLLEQQSHIKLWYVSLPKKVLDRVSLPEYLATNVSYKEKRTYPTHKIWVGPQGVFNKIRAVYGYKSQRLSYLKGVPIKQVPLWFYISLTPFEYFHEVK